MNAEMTGIIFDIQKFSSIDGPGIRTTVFFKGCNLRCAWCHNPESQSMASEMLLWQNKCTGCGKCREVCPGNADGCLLCGKCTVYCPAHAREISGREYSVAEVFDQIRSDKMFYDASGGGVTFSGGECMLQHAFLAALAKKCRDGCIHTAVDTAGCVPWEYFEEVLPYTDMFLYDVKCLSDELHREGTGVSNRIIIENLTRLSDETDRDIIVRVPIIPGFNTDISELELMAEFLSGLRLRAVELLPYHKMGENKYTALSRKAAEFEVPGDDSMKKYREIFGLSET